jgi:hypothetical protein
VLAVAVFSVAAAALPYCVSRSAEVLPGADDARSVGRDHVWVIRLDAICAACAP